jgi:hypothetical protein
MPRHAHCPTTLPPAAADEPKPADKEELLFTESEVKAMVDKEIEKRMAALSEDAAAAAATMLVDKAA